jgi:hypothetical protein
MLTPAQAHKLLRRIAFKIRIEKHRHGYWEWGTGFFISSNGYALTAFHNLPRSVITAGHGTIEAFYKGQTRDEQKLALECLIDLSLPEHEGDIAVLKLLDPPTMPIHSLPIAYLDLALSYHLRSQFWAGRPVCAFGFPFEKEGQGERFVDGNIDSTQPLVMIDIKESEGAGPNIVGVVECLRFYGGERAKELKGISGAPILDRETGWIVAVEHRYVPELNIIYGTEIAHLLEKWPEELREQAMPLAYLFPWRIEEKELKEAIIKMKRVQFSEQHIKGIIDGKETILTSAEVDSLVSAYLEFFPIFHSKYKDSSKAHFLSVLRAWKETWGKIPSEHEIKELKDELSRKCELFWELITEVWRELQNRLGQDGALHGRQLDEGSDSIEHQNFHEPEIRKMLMTEHYVVVRVVCKKCNRLFWGRVKVLPAIWRDWVPQPEAPYELVCSECGLPSIYKGNELDVVDRICVYEDEIEHLI